MAVRSDARELHLWHLKQCPLFARLGPGELDAVYAASQIVSLGPEEIVPPADESEGALWIMKRGHVKLSYIDAGGHEATVLVLGPGDIFGGLHGAQDYGEHCRTMTACCLVRIARSRFEGLVRKYPDIAYTINKANFDRIHRLQVRMAEMLMRPIDQRLALALLDLDRQVGEDSTDPPGRRLGLPLSHRDLAMLVGSSREMVTHVMGRLRDKGFVDAARKHVVLLDMAGLKELAGK